MNTFEIILLIIASFWVVLTVIGLLRKPSSIYKNDPGQKNPMEGRLVRFVEDPNEPENADGVRGHLEAVGEAGHNTGIYERIVKRLFDIVLSAVGIVVLLPAFITISIIILITDPGPIFFTQKRVGKNKRYFKLHKFRSMKMSTPHNVPTHMLENPEQYITKVGAFIRKHSLDELPQIWDIFIGNMSVIGPRPALWNQDLLIAERDKYGANNVKPGLTGWAQINGRDELDISLKAALDGEYVKKESFTFDCRCFAKTVLSVLKSDGIVEGGTGAIHSDTKH